ncbi:beta-glucuronosyltransferase GlcAT14A [Andrographis paniculata]|uniref:beta-glucuronosyltransferase GlcAT14A n=1 Tax=Andrographis paniculata TaxID=175694 RepID=UPI0021E6FBB2|nr:beta-glucuronosyltransferase GlcAT14A [Andrographis paniculata]
MAVIKLFLISFILTSLIISAVYNIPTNRRRHPIPTYRRRTSLFIPNNAPGPYNATFAYLISGAGGDTMRLKRLLLAVYHPANVYLIHLDAAAPAAEQREMGRFVAGQGVFSEVGNVWVVGKPNVVTYRGPTMVAATLQAMAALLRAGRRWDWFINLSASDYPLITQDDLIHAFSDVPKDLNFVQHTSRLGWKLNKRGKPIIIDPALYSANKSEIWWVIKQRALPTAFKLYTGSAWTILSRSFAEFVIMGWDNLPRTLLLYYTNFVSSPEGYFQTILCNSDHWKNTTINHDLHYISWDVPPKQHPRSLGLKDYRKMVLSNRPFARKFKKNDPVLNRIDRELLKRGSRQFSWGGWCSKDDGGNKCSELYGENYGVLRVGGGSRRLRILLRKLVRTRNFGKRQCK